MHENCHQVFLSQCLPAILDLQSSETLRVLEIGPDGFPSRCETAVDIPRIWFTLDLILRHPSQDFVARGPYDYPIDDSTFDVTLSTQVLEHVPAPWLWIIELARITRMGGLVIMIAPANWPYHEVPQDCWRAYPDGLRALYEHGGLEVISCGCSRLSDEGVEDVFCIGRKV